MIWATQIRAKTSATSSIELRETSHETDRFDNEANEDQDEGQGRGGIGPVVHPK